MRYPQMDDWWCRYVAETAGVTVVNVDFRAGPYVRYPVAQHEAHDAAAWVASHGAPVAVGGFSSGAGLAAATACRPATPAPSRPSCRCSACPALDVAAPPALPVGHLVRRVYFPDPGTRSSSYASPLLAPSVADLPPAVVLTGPATRSGATGSPTPSGCVRRASTSSTTTPPVGTTTS